MDVAIDAPLQNRRNNIEHIAWNKWFLALPSKARVAFQGKDIVFRFMIEYSSLRDFGL
jgi:hypothetical protein